MSLSQVTKVRMTYSQLTSFIFAQICQKLASTPTDGKTACRIRQITRGTNEARTKVIKEYEADITEVYAKRDENGVIIRPEGQPKGFTAAEGKEAESESAQEEFVKREIELECIPLTLADLKDIKITPAELEALGGFFTETPASVGPGVPDNVKSITG